jgi:hypothetical protein
MALLDKARTHNQQAVSSSAGWSFHGRVGFEKVALVHFAALIHLQLLLVIYQSLLE